MYDPRRIPDASEIVTTKMYGSLSENIFRESAHIRDVHPFPHNCWITCLDKKRLAILAFPGHGYWTRPTVISPSFLAAAFVSCPFVIFLLDPKALGGDTIWEHMLSRAMNGRHSVICIVAILPLLFYSLLDFGVFLQSGFLRPSWLPTVDSSLQRRQRLSSKRSYERYQQAKQAMKWNSPLLEFGGSSPKEK